MTTCKHDWHFVQGLTARLRCTRCGIMTWPKDAEQKVQEVLQDVQTDREIMQQALEALDLLSRVPKAKRDYADRAIAALRDRLAQPEQEPVFDCPRCGHCCPPQGIYYTPQRKPLPPQSPCEMTQAEGKMFKLGWLECEAAHGIKGKA